MNLPHTDDEFHTPSSDDPYWTETCWFTFAVPELKLSGQLYPFFQPNQKVAAAGAYFWDAEGDQPWNCRYAKNFWHVPIGDQKLSNLTLANGIHYRCLEPLQKYHLRYDDPDGDEVHVDLLFTALREPHYLGRSHLDQPGRYRGEIVLHGKPIHVDSYGFRDRSWGRRPQFGQAMVKGGAAYGGYSYATASEQDGFHTLTWDQGEGCASLHGYYLRNGQWAKLKHARREVVARNPANGHPTEIHIHGTDELGRTLDAQGRALNGLGVFINPNMYTINCLTEWRFDGVTAFGEDHDNWSAPAIRRFMRDFLKLRTD